MIAYCRAGCIEHLIRVTGRRMSTSGTSNASPQLRFARAPPLAWRARDPGGALRRLERLMSPHYGEFIAYFRVSTDRQGEA
jgi:hypothetical protein